MKKVLLAILFIIIGIGLAIGGYALYNHLTKPKEEKVELKVTINDTVLTEDVEMQFGYGSENVVKIEGANEYNVKIISNDENAFIYTVNGEEKVFENLDLTEKFDIDYKSDGFTLTFEEDFNIEDIIKELHEEGDVIELPVFENVSLFTLVLEFENDVTYNVSFIIDRIVLSESEIVI